VTTLSPIVSTQKNFDDLGFAEDHPGRRLTDSYYINATTMLRTHTSAHEVEIFSQGKDKWLLTADVYRRDEIDASHYPVFHQMEGARTFALSDPDMEARLEKENTRLDKQLADANILIEDDTRISPANPYQISHNPRHAELVTANLKHSLNSLILTLFGGRDANRESPLRVRWIEAFFPFTTPSYEVEVFFQGKWLEILGCGVVQQATLDRASK
jgi:phenylalanyl-tRNA synthetase alpha chain